jgi:hypothetical protein
MNDATCTTTQTYKYKAENGPLQHKPSLAHALSIFDIRPFGPAVHRNSADPFTKMKWQ